MKRENPWKEPRRKSFDRFSGISAGDGATTTQFIDKERFVQHNPIAANGVEGLTQEIRRTPRDQLSMTVVRAIQDGAYVANDEGQTETHLLGI